MALKIDKMKKAYQDSKQGGEFWSPDEGETKVYLLPPCREDDKWEPTEGLNYIPIAVHFGVGRENKMIVCLDAEQNPIIRHQFVIDALKKSGKIVDKDKGCPVCKAIHDGRMGEEDAARSRFQMRFMWGVIPINYARRIGAKPADLDPKAFVYMCGKSVYDGFMKVIYEAGDITDPAGAVFVKIEKTGTGMTTKYKVSPDIESLKTPVQLPKSMKRIILDAIKLGGDCDLFKIAGGLIRGTAEVAAVLSGVKTEEEDDKEGEEEAGPVRKPCFGLDCMDDPECRACEDRVECASKCAVPVPGSGKAAAKPEAKAEPEAADEPEAEGEAAEEPEAEGDDEAPAEEAADEPEGGNGKDAPADDAELDELEAKLAAMSKKKGAVPAVAPKKSVK